METITIGSFNLRNHYWDRNWNGDNFPHELAIFIKQNNINFLGTQELVKKYADKLQKELGDKYSINGNYRYGRIPFIDQFNEANAIITDRPVIQTETKHLATIPFLDHLTQMPRIMTSIETPEYFIINTHIEYLTDIAQKHQLKVLYDYIQSHQEKKPIITGDFNMNTSKKHFLEFIDAITKLGIYHIDNNVPTYTPKEQILDHIFVPNTYEIIDIQTIQEQAVNNISDHRPILAKIRKR